MSVSTPQLLHQIGVSGQRASNFSDALKLAATGHSGGGSLYATGDTLLRAITQAHKPDVEWLLATAIELARLVSDLQERIAKSEGCNPPSRAHTKSAEMQPPSSMREYDEVPSNNK